MSSPHTTHDAKTYCATLIGCGKMGSAMMTSWLDNGLVSRVDVVDPSPLATHLSNDPRVHYYPSYQEDMPDADILVLAVKPQILKEASQKIANNISSKTVLLSIAAGQRLSTLESIFGSNQPIIRTMPNTPAAIGKGISVSVGNKYVTSAQKETADTLLRASGEHKWIEDERLMDAVTALSGSGPAYVFHFIEALANAGKKLGLDADLSMSLARQTVIGSSALAEHDGDVSAETLRENVTSPGGTTQAALETLMDGRFQTILDEALNAAKKRSQELS
ncbi:MAG: pyrroline-5-carboxylate reductase [Alphaproteobacteria bacterium]|nr:MAG: pyrroline-5-carboxylate reductase [Alphaproteobacteria bacterium]